jgi:GNAT superfamily N-acetyltransferase
MTWRVTGSLDEFLTAAHAHLRADPVRNTVLMTVLETLRTSGVTVYGADAPVFGWHEESPGNVNGAFLQTPPFPVLTANLPTGSAESLIETLISKGRKPAAVNLAGSDEAEFVDAWANATGTNGAVHMRSRLFRLTGLTPPDPLPPGAARVASQSDFDLLVNWSIAFSAETGAVSPENPGFMVDDKLSHGGLMLWEVESMPVAMAGLTRNVAGVVRVASVYTPPEQRRRGYGGAVTTAASQTALDYGADEVVLFTDQANPTSNALYQRLGYRPIEDRVVLDLDVTSDQPTTS